MAPALELDARTHIIYGKWFVKIQRRINHFSSTVEFSSRHSMVLCTTPLFRRFVLSCRDAFVQCSALLIAQRNIPSPVIQFIFKIIYEIFSNSTLVFFPIFFVFVFIFWRIVPVLTRMCLCFVYIYFVSFVFGKCFPFSTQAKWKM